MKIINAFISKARWDQKEACWCVKNFETAEAYYSNCREKLLRECKGLKYYSDQHLMIIKLKINVAVQKIIITVV